MQTIESEIDLGGLIAPVKARINRRARRLIVRVDSLNGTVMITAPSKRSLPEAYRFARTRASWIKQELNNGPKARKFEEGGLCPFRGVDHIIRNIGSPRSRITVINDELSNRAEIHVGGEAIHLNRRLTDWLKREARQELTRKSDFYSERLGVKRGKIRIGDTKSRWGSCSQDGTLSYSWRLILAPNYILDYVAAHECAHLVHLNHSPAYWKLLASLDVDAKAANTWFRNHGERLFAYGVA